MITRWRAPTIATLALSFALGCHAEPPPGEARSAITAVCPGTRQVGRVAPSQTCPAPTPGSGWVGESLFDGLGASLPRVCVYTWTGTGPANQSTLPWYGATPPSAWLDPDCMSVAMLSETSAVLAALEPELEQSFSAQIEAPTGSITAPGGGSVRLAVIDSWPESGTLGNADHGFGMAAIAHRTACNTTSSSACPTTVEPTLALDLVDANVQNTFLGGYFGYQSRLAQAIAKAVHHHVASTPQSKLVINLSVGWDARYNDGPDGLISEPVKAVRAALEYAACSGALVFAAAGNAGSGPDPGSGPMYPAAWQSVAAPACAGPVARPLVVAVSGVTGHDVPLSNARPGARAELAAPAFAVPGAMDLGSSPIMTGPFTGSSVASAVASGIAAAVWNAAPSLRPDQVVGLMRSSAVVSPEPADFCFGSPCGQVRRLSLGRALAAAGSSLPFTPIPFGAGENPTVTAADRGAIDALATASYDGTDLTSLVSPSGCSSDVYVSDGLTSFPGPWPCPLETLMSSVTTPGVSPQPDPHPCPACVFHADPVSPVIYLAISDRFDTVYPQILSLEDRSGDTLARFDLERAEADGVPLSLGLSGGKVYKAALPSIRAEVLDALEHAVVEWVDERRAVTTSALLIER